MCWWFTQKTLLLHWSNVQQESATGFLSNLPNFPTLLENLEMNLCTNVKYVLSLAENNILRQCCKHFKTDASLWHYTHMFFFTLCSVHCHQNNTKYHKLLSMIFIFFIPITNVGAVYFLLYRFLISKPSKARGWYKSSYFFGH